jgi:two-component system, LytTR family, response regulator
MCAGMMLKTLIADDEPLSRERLRFLLCKYEWIEIAGECRNGREVIATLKEKEIDLLFLDIQMPGHDGFDVIDKIGLVHMPVTVFVTAHDQYAVKAFEVHALDYLTKPVEPVRLQATLTRVKERIASRAALMTQEQLTSVLASLANGAPARKAYPKRLLVHNGNKDSFVNVNEIEWIEAADYYSCLHVGSKSFLLREPIKHLAATLDPGKFVRIHRSIVVNVDQVREILREGRGEGSVVLANGQRVRMSKPGWQNLLATGRT